MSIAIVSLSLPLGETAPVRTSSTPAPPSWPPCQTYSTAAGLYFSTHFMSMMLPTFSSTATRLNAPQTVSSICSSVFVSR